MSISEFQVRKAALSRVAARLGAALSEASDADRRWLIAELKLFMARTQRHFPPYPQALAKQRAIHPPAIEGNFMSLEQTLAAHMAATEANTVAVRELIAVMGKGGTAGSTGATTTTGKTPKDKKPASEHTREEMAAALNSVKEKHGAPEAKAIIKSIGGVDKLADIPDAKIDAVYDAAVTKEAEEEPM